MSVLVGDLLFNACAKVSSMTEDVIHNREGSVRLFISIFFKSHIFII